MREIKFRVQRSDTKEWLYFTLGDLVGCLEVSTVGKGYDYVAETWCEWTGLHDKNGKPIYEGDVVKRNDVTGVVQYNAPEFHFLNDFDGEDTDNGWLFDHEGKPLFEVIGNVYENPELLKE